jgi:imidazole glycerol-phosphate synthase subunit HisF
MTRIRVIPVLLIQDKGLVKTVKFKNPTYVGDPINAVKIYNEKEIDEIVILDIDASKEKRTPNFTQIKEIADEAFIPLAYGGGISTIEEISKLFYLGVEKVIINFSAYANISLVSDAARLVGSQSIVVSMDVKKNMLGHYKVFVKNGSVNTGISPVAYAKKMEEAGAGEIFLNSIDRDGSYNGYDLHLIKQTTEELKIPLIACGGASGIPDFVKAVQNGASAVAAGSIFVFQKPHRAVLISYPTQKELSESLYSIV